MVILWLCHFIIIIIIHLVTAPSSMWVKNGPHMVLWSKDLELVSSKLDLVLIPPPTCLLACFLSLCHRGITKDNNRICQGFRGWPWKHLKYFISLILSFILALYTYRCNESIYTKLGSYTLNKNQTSCIFNDFLYGLLLSYPLLYGNCNSSLFGKGAVHRRAKKTEKKNIVAEGTVWVQT